ncbi:MAG: GAF domain-containing protein, partial [Paracoccus sp. (in: a-proteobacteria)]
GAAARAGTVPLVAAVADFPGHSACAAASGSGAGLPVSGRAGRLIGVLDIDSDQPDAFTPEDARRLELILAEVFGGL